MKPSHFKKNIRALLLPFLLVSSLLVWQVSIHADQAQYFYDELGRLVGVVDSQGNAAVYNYDAVGNLLSIQRFTSGATGIGIFFLSPSSGGIGAQVEIRGFGFSATPGNNQVTFNGTPTTVTTATVNSLLVTVPAGATSGTVTVTNANGSANSPQPFTVLVSTITGIDPNRVAQSTSILAHIAGTNLATATAVTFSHSGITATIAAGATAQQLPISMSVASSVPAGTYTFSVTTALGEVQSGTVTVSVFPLTTVQTTTQVSVFRPLPAQVAPSGGTAIVGPPASASMP